MMKFIQNIDVYAPQHLGQKDVLTVNDKIVKVTDAGTIQGVTLFPELEIVDGTGKILTPGFIDCHVHVLGGGGEGLAGVGRDRCRFAGDYQSYKRADDDLERCHGAVR